MRLLRRIGRRDALVAERLDEVRRALKLVDKRLAVVEKGQTREVGRLDYEGADVRLVVSTRTELSSRLRSVSKEPWTVEWIEASVGAGDVLWDVGANVGAYALVAARAADEGARVVAVEPGFANYAALCDNVALNGLEGVITCLPVALGSASGLLSMHFSDLGAGAASHTVAGAGAGHAVLGYALDELLERFALPAPTLLKIDVDGGEVDVLRGAARTLRRPELRSVLVEVDRELGEEVTSLLGDAGFRLARRVDERAGKAMPRIWYGVFDRA